jgi:methylthioribulose-1-phosphate dehydratase
VPPRSPSSIPRDLIAVGRRFYARGWVQGTSGNFSAVVSQKPLRLAITASSVHKGLMRAEHILQLNASGTTIGARRALPSAEARLHLEIVRRRGAGAVLHTHSIWGTILSASAVRSDRVTIDGFEMLKGLSGVRTHEHAEHIPIIENDQDMSRLAGVVGETLDRNPDAHAFLLRRHGLYTWGDTLADAERHVEILEFLFETIGRSKTFRPPGGDSGGEAYHGATENS